MSRWLARVPTVSRWREHCISPSQPAVRPLLPLSHRLSCGMPSTLSCPTGLCAFATRSSSPSGNSTLMPLQSPTLLLVPQTFTNSVKPPLLSYGPSTSFAWHSVSCPAAVPALPNPGHVDACSLPALSHPLFHLQSPLLFELQTMPTTLHLSPVLLMVGAGCSCSRSFPCPCS